jgi:hypothetical protein
MSAPCRGGNVLQNYFRLLRGQHWFNIAHQRTILIQRSASLDSIVAHYDSCGEFCKTFGGKSGLGQATGRQTCGVVARLKNSKRSIMLERPPATKTLCLAQFTLFAPLLMAAWLGLVFAPAYRPVPADLRVFGAASLKDAIDDANVRYQRVIGRQVVASYGGSDTMAKQIENGAPAGPCCASPSDA